MKGVALKVICPGGISHSPCSWWFEQGAWLSRAPLARPAGSSLSMPCCGAQAFDKWRAEHSATVLAVRQAVADASASDAALRPLVEEARGQLWTLFAMKKAVICSESVLIIMNMEHLLPAVSLQRPPAQALLHACCLACAYVIQDIIPKQARASASLVWALCICQCNPPFGFGHYLSSLLESRLSTARKHLLSLARTSGPLSEQTY